MISAPIQASIAEAVAILRNGGVISYPTDTLYGLGVAALSGPALRRVLRIKGRPGDKGLPLLLAQPCDMESVASFIPDYARRLAARFWPGPLTLVLPAKPGLPPELLGPSGGVGVRVPDHGIPRALARGLGGPIVGTSANPSGGPDPLTAQDVERSLGGRVDYIIDGGPAPGGVASTVVDLTGPRPRMLRIGALSAEDLRRECGVEVEQPRSAKDNRERS